MVASKKEASSSHSRMLILQSALHLFSTRGYDGTSIDDIREAAGFKSKASLYTHFKSKEEVASALLQNILAEEEEAALQALSETQQEPLQKFVALGKAFVTWGVSHPQEYAFCFLRVQQELLIQGKPTSTDEQPQASDQLLLDLIHELRKKYPVRSITDTALLSMMIGLISRAIIDQTAFGTVDQETRVQQIIEACFGLLFSQPVSFPECC
jgi:Transcriptional regulator